MKTNLHLLTRAATLLTLAATARGNVIDAQFNGIGQFSFGVEYMTDLDQRRDGLPGDGKAFCVPASAMNLFAYAANFGFPAMLPGPGIWEGVAGHDQITDYLEVLGQTMSTDADDGTTLTGQAAGFAAWLQVCGLSGMPVVTMARDDDYWPTVDVGAYMGTAGAVVNFAYGRYEWTPGPMGEVWLTNRTSGHSVTLQRAVADNGQFLGPRQVRIHNPSGSHHDGDLHSNSDYYSQDLPDSQNIEVGLDGDDDGDFEYSIATSLVNPEPDDNRWRLIDSVTGLYPPGGMSYTEVQVNAQFVGGGLGFVSDRKPTTHGVAAGASIVSVIPHPELHSALAVVRGPSGDGLYQLPNGTDRKSRLLDLPSGTRALVLGYGQSVYAVGSTSIAGLRVRSRDASVLGTVPLPLAVRNTPIDAAAYNEATDELLLLSGSGRRLFVFNAATLKLSQTYALQFPTQPAAIRSVSVLPVSAAKTAGSSPSPRRLVLALAQGGLAQLDYQKPGTPLAGGVASVQLSRLALPGVVDPLSADLDGGGRLYVADRSAGLLEYVSSSTGAWVRASRAYFTAKQFVGRKFVAFRSRSNLRPGIHDQPEWRHVVDDRE